jgi:tetratricopeptide (TPR) repeat protein
MFERALVAEQAVVAAGGTLIEAPFIRAFASVTLAEQGAFDEALRRAGEAVALAEAHASAYELVHALGCLGYVLLRRGSAQPAVDALERGLDLCRGRDFGFLAGMVAPVLGLARALAGRPEAGIALLEPSAGSGLPVIRGLSMVWLAEAYARAGRHDEARRRAADACVTTTTMGEHGHRGWALRALGDGAAAADPPDVDQAETAYREALAIAEERGMALLAAYCRAGLGRLAIATGRREEGRLLVVAALEAFRRMGTMTDAAVAERALNTAE